MPGRLVLLGSGESAPSVQRVYTWLFQPYAVPVRVAILETPAGFEVNSPDVAGAVATYLEGHLVNFRPQSTVVAARRRDGTFSTNNPAILAPLASADVILAGPGSPSYAVRHLRDSRAWNLLRAHHRLGGGLFFSSAVTLAAGRSTLPVYEIYKVGEELHWKSGLDLLSDYGIRATFVSHWNNNDGGAALDTSRCYMGRDRFARLVDLLPEREATTLVGIDERTALCIDFHEGRCLVLGEGGVTLRRAGVEQLHGRGTHFPLTELGDYHPPDDDLSHALLDEVRAGHSAAVEAAPIPHEVSALVAQREAARAASDWPRADTLRAEIARLGWLVLDTPAGPQLDPAPER